MRLAVALAALTGCADPSLDITVEHPAGVVVTKTVVTVYESDSLHCDDIAFSRLGPDELTAVKTAESDDGDLSGISRTDHKVIVARGYGDAGWVTAGCAEGDVVEGTQKVTIKTIATVNAATVQFMADMNDPTKQIVGATDTKGKAVANRRVSWTVYGFAGAEPMYPAMVTTVSDGVWVPAQAACTDTSGAAVVHPIPPSAIGGHAVQLAVEWAIQQPTLYSRLAGAGTPQSVTPPNNSRTYCALDIKSSGRRVACLDGNTVNEYTIEVSGDSARFVLSRSFALTGTEWFALVSIPNGDDRDVYAMSTRGVVAKPFEGPTPAPATAAPCIGGLCAVDDVVVVPTCGTQPARLFVHTTGAGPTLRLLDARGGNEVGLPTGLTPADLIEIDNAGCVTRLDPGGGAPTVRQVMTIHIGTLDALSEFIPSKTRAIYNCAGTCMGNDLLGGAGVGFTTGSEPHMITTSLDATGVVLQEVVLAPGNSDGDLLVERTRIPAASAPTRIVVGQFDSDSMADLFWSLSVRRGAAFEVAYARKIGSLPLEALSQSAQGLSVFAMATGDLTGEGRDDIMATGSFAGFPGVSVIPVGLTATPASIGSDTGCQ
jgi:hypothetical protein